MTFSSARPPEPDMRCGSCKAIGCECPQGYFSGAVRCDVCGYRFVLCCANCAPIIPCHECGGSLDYGEEK